MSYIGSDDGDVYKGSMIEDESELQFHSQSVAADADLARSNSVDAENDNFNTTDSMQGVVYTGDSTLKGAATGLEPIGSEDDQAFQGQSGRYVNQGWRMPPPEEADGLWLRLEECMAKLSL